MPAFTTRYGLYKPGGGSTGLITPDEVADIDKLNANFDTIDGALGSGKGTSGTRPSVPKDGQLFLETDTGNLISWDATGSYWRPATQGPYCSNQAVRDAFYPNPKQGDTVFRADRQFYEQYYAAYNSSTNTGGAKVAGWYPATGQTIGALVTKDIAQNGATSATTVTWSSNAIGTAPGNLEYDTHGFYDVAHTDRFTIPAYFPDNCLYRIRVFIPTSGVTARTLTLLVNGTASGPLGSATGAVAAASSVSGNSDWVFSHGDYVGLSVADAAAALPMNTGINTQFEFTYVRPSSF